MNEPMHAARAEEVRSEARILKQEIRGLLKEADANLTKTFTTGREIGIRLLKLREAVAHGQWLPMLDELEVNRVTAWRCMKLAQQPFQMFHLKHLSRALRELDQKESGGGVKGKKPKPRTKFTWKDFDKEFGPVARVPDRIAERYEAEKDSDEYRRAGTLLDEFAAVMDAWRARLDK